MRIGVLGVGGIGGVIGGGLVRAGRQVTLVDMWPANIEKIKADGLTVTTLEEEFAVEADALHLGEVATARPAFDVVFLSMKSYDTPWASMFIAPYLAPGGYIVSAQNGINEDAIAQVVGWPRVVGCVITLGAAMYEPGHAMRTSAGDRHAFTVGEPSGLMSRRAEKLAEVLGDVGHTTTTTNLWGERWSKLATNSMSNAAAGFTGLNSAELKGNPQTRWLAIRVAAELASVAAALGVTVEPIGGIPADMFQEALTDGAVREEVEGRIADGARTIGTGRPSLAQDLMKGRRTEVHNLNGYVVRKGAEVGVPTPVNEAVIELTERVESGEIEPSLTNLAAFETM